MGYKKVIVNIKFNQNELEKLDKDLDILLNSIKNNEINIYFGFDIAKEFNYLSILLEKDTKIKIYDIAEIKNSEIWFKNLEKVLNVIEKKWVNKNNIFIGMEATWSYYFSLIKFLNKKNYNNVYVINAAKIKQYAKKDNNSNVKNDKKDSIMIWSYLYDYKNYLENDNTYNTYNKGDIIKTKEEMIFDNKKHQLIHRTKLLEISNLRLLYRWLSNEKEELVKVKNRIKELTNRIMPEIYKVFNPNKYSNIELYIKSHFTKDEIITLSEEEFYTKVMKWTGNRNKNDVRYNNKLKKLQELLKNWIWLDDDCWFLKWQMKLYVDKYYSIQNNILNTENLILMEIKNKNIFIPKIYWVSSILLWVFYSEMWDYLFTKSIKELVGFIWWYPTQNMSWWATLRPSIMQKKWNYLLRKTIYLIIFTMTWHIKEINEYKEYLKIKKNIESKQALIESASKVLKIILSLFKNKQDFDLWKFKEFLDAKVV